MATPIPKNQAAFTLGEIANATSGALHGAAALAVRGVTTDSRAVAPGELYVALRGEHFDGHRFVAKALQAGAAAVLVSDANSLPSGAPAVVVGDTLHALGELAARHRARWGGRVLAVTGSAGKTTTKELAFAALRAAGAKVARSQGNLNNLVGAPMSLLTLDAGSELMVLEIGTSAPGEIARLSEIARPEVGIVTAVAVAHADGLGSLEQVAAEKAALLRALPESGTAIYRSGDPLIAAQLTAVRAKRRLAFGSDEAADVRLLSSELSIGGTAPAFRGGASAPAMVCELSVRAPARDLRVALQLFGIGPALDAAAALAAVLALLGPDALDAALGGLGEVAATPGRLAALPGPAGSLVIDDSYNANPASMRASIDTALELARLRGGRAVLVLGDMLELGARAREEHEEVGRLAAQSGVAMLLACGPQMTAAAELARETAQGAEPALSVLHLADPAGAAELLRPLLAAADVVLVKGSRSMSMERVVQGLAAAEGGR
jgi:UDP-N-acetylmuramoyl-tripeptide--D-alanyl-D-alanine ligase